MVQWLGSPNYTAGREGHDMAVAPSYVVLHTMVGSEPSANDRFQNPAQQASAHYGVTVDGSVYQWVREDSTAWHAGTWSTNLNSIGIEHEDMGNYDAPRPDALYRASAALVRDICLRYGIPIQRGDVAAERSGIVDHRTVTSTACPDALDTSRIIAMAASNAQPPPTTAPGGGTMFRPAGPSNRSDSAYLAGGHVWHMWRGGDSNASIEDRGTAPNGGRFVAIINQGWDTASAAFNVEALSSDGQIYRAFWPFDPSQPAQDWTPITYNGGASVKADIPAGPTGTTDPALAAEVAKIKAREKAAGAALDGP